jgi:hypothetical protein
MLTSRWATSPGHAASLWRLMTFIPYICFVLFLVLAYLTFEESGSVDALWPVVGGV